MEDTSPPGGAERPEARERFLAEFMKSWLEGRDLQGLVAESARRLRALLDADRLTVSFLRETDGHPRLVAGATDSAPGVPPLPASLADVSIEPLLRVMGARAFRSGDVLEEPDLAPLREVFRSAGTRAMLFVPIRIAGRLRGAVTATTLRERTRDFHPGEMAFLETAVGYISAALRDAELLEQLSRERDRQRVLFDVAMAVQRAADVPELVRTVLERLKDPLGFPLGIFGLVAPGGGSMAMAGGYGGSIDAAHPLPDVVFRTSGLRTLSQQVLDSAEPLVIEDLEADPRAQASRTRLVGLGARSVVALGLRVSERPLGVLLVGRGPGDRRIEPEDVLVLRSLAGFVSVALDQRRSAEAAGRATREARALSEASRALLTRTASRDVLLEQVLDALVLHFGQENCRLLLVDPARGVLVPVAHRGDWTGAIPDRSMPLSGPGLTAAAALTGRVVNAADVRAEPAYVEGWPAARSELVVPLKIGDEVVGVLDLQSPRPAAFGEEEVGAVSAFADRAALAVRLAGLVGQLEERTRVLEAVTRATRLLTARLSAPDVLTALAEETGRTFPGAAGAAVLVADDAGRTLAVAAAYGIGHAVDGLAGGVPQPLVSFPCAGRAYAEDRPVFLSTSGVDELLAGGPPEVRDRVRAAVGGSQLRHLLAVPVHVGERRLGVLEVVGSGERSFDGHDAETLTLLADHAAIALRNARTVEELQRSNRLKDDFLANLSHEVRTPLTGIVGWSEVLLDARGDDPETRRALQAILGQAETLSRMLADLIDLSRIDNFGLELRRVRVSLAEVTRAAIESVAPGAAKRNVTVTHAVSDALPGLVGDPSRIQQVVWNLLTNAVKFSPAGATVSVSAEVPPEGGLELSVTDAGSGIDPAFLPFVFDRFRQEETSFNRRFGGLGVGLAIARAIVEAHDGTIEATSAGRGKGCRFVVRFPKERVALASGTFPRVPAPAAAALSLLVVEPDASHRAHVSRLCESLGFETTAVPGPDEALAAASILVPDVLVADLAISESSEGLLRKLRELEGAERTRWVALADADDSRSRRTAAQAGFREIVTRPARRIALERALLSAGPGGTTDEVR